MDEQTYWQNQLLEDRLNKDEFFKEHGQSPLSSDDLERFSGLDFFEPDWSLRLPLKLDESKPHTEVKINDTKGQVRDMVRWGLFHFTVGGKESHLSAYKASDEGGLFVPFKDATSGKETYGAGRYLDLSVAELDPRTGLWLVDFNLAYNPWCAYSEDYACPLVPPENWLKVPIRAGEKQYPLEK